MPASGDKDQIDWNSLQIEERLDEEGRLEVIDEDQIFKLLGLRMVDDDVPMGTDDIVNDGQERQNHIDASGNDADIDPEIPVYDDVPEERVFVHAPLMGPKRGKYCWPFYLFVLYFFSSTFL
jgi:hypothetical protein